MIRTDRRAFRPVAERFEGRELAAGGLAGALAGVSHRPAAVHHPAPLARAHETHGPHAAGSGIGPGLGQGLLRLTLPLSYGKFGVVTLWNNTTTRVDFAASASTYAGGQFFAFALRPGQVRSFFAPVDPVTGTPPVFQVGFGPRSAPVVLPQVNTVFEAPNYFPAGTAGYPYAVNFGPYGYTVSRI